MADQQGNVLAVIPTAMDADPYYPLKWAGYYISTGGWAALRHDGRPVTILVRRRPFGPAA